MGLKPTVGLVSRSGIIPISSSQDTAGSMSRCVADAAALLGAMTGVDVRDAEYQVMLYEFKAGLNNYFASLGPAARVRTVEELISFNERSPERELILFGQETLIEAQGKGPLSEQRYLDAKARCAKWSKEIEAVLESNQLDAILAPTTGPAHTLDLVVGDRGLGGSSTYAAVSGLPSITVPCGEVSGLPVGLSFIAPAWQEARLLALAYAFEQATQARKPPRFLPTLELKA